MPKGVKTCPKCKSNCGPRSEFCPNCKHSFFEKSKPLSKLDEIKRILSQETPKEQPKPQPKKIFSNAIIAPSGKSPVKFKDDVIHWYTELLKIKPNLSVKAALYWLRTEVDDLPTYQKAFRELVETFPIETIDEIG